MRYLHIQTPYGDSYTIRENDGAISRDDGQWGYSGNWLLLGFVTTSGKRRFIPLNEIFRNGIPEPLRFKNRNPRYTVRDMDHGTMREWGNTQYHGIGSAWITEE